MLVAAGAQSSAAQCIGNCVGAGGRTPLNPSLNHNEESEER